jgi:hypothetical protein
MKLLEAGKLDETVAAVWLGAAIGDERLLKGRKPNFAFFKELMDRIEGPVPAPKPEPEIDVETAAAALDEFAPDDHEQPAEVPGQSEPVQ